MSEQNRTTAITAAKWETIADYVFDKKVIVTFGGLEVLEVMPHDVDFVMLSVYSERIGFDKIKVQSSEVLDVRWLDPANAASPPAPESGAGETVDMPLDYSPVTRTKIVMIDADEYANLQRQLADTERERDLRGQFLDRIVAIRQSFNTDSNSWLDSIDMIERQIAEAQAKTARLRDALLDIADGSDKSPHSNYQEDSRYWQGRHDLFVGIAQDALKSTVQPPAVDVASLNSRERSVMQYVGGVAGYIKPTVDDGEIQSLINKGILTKSKHEGQFIFTPLGEQIYDDWQNEVIPPPAVDPAVAALMAACEQFVGLWEQYRREREKRLLINPDFDVTDWLNMYERGNEVHNMLCELVNAAAALAKAKGEGEG